MQQPYKDDTQQERHVRSALDSYGYSYIEQCDWFKPYIVDFFLPELNIVIEADGHYGHYSKRDRKRDMNIMETYLVDRVVHIKSQTLEGIIEDIWQEFDKFQEEEPANLEPNGNPQHQ